MVLPGHYPGPIGEPIAHLFKEKKMLWTIIVVLVVLWLLGFTLNIGGGLIHTLLVIALIVFIYNMVTGRRG